MAKKRTAEQEAMRTASKLPEKRFFMSRRICWAFGKRPFKWGFFTNYNEVSIDVGNPPYQYHRGDIPESAWSIWFRAWPPKLIVFKHNELIVYTGEKKWNRDSDV